MSWYIYSTLSNDNSYVIYHPKVQGNLPQVRKSITIKGKANLAHGGDYGLVTPLGMRTVISNEDYEDLKDIHLFKTHVENGHIIAKYEEKQKADKVAKDMNKDVCAPPTPKYFEDQNKPVPADFVSPDGRMVKGGKYNRL
jgi:hypothetical protein